MRPRHYATTGDPESCLELFVELQALALILTRAREGPCLVVAPTSVCPNWADEAARFAPTLNVIPFGPGDRGRTIEDLKPFDLLVASYGLLLQETERPFFAS